MSNLDLNNYDNLKKILFNFRENINARQGQELGQQKLLDLFAQSAGLHNHNTLKAVLEDKNKVSPGSAPIKPLETLELRFDVSGSVKQTIDMLADIDADELVEGLESGEYATTLYHDEDSNPTIDVVATGETIAIIRSTEVDGDYDEFYSL